VTRSRTRGFTLVELLISLALLGILLTAVVSINIGTSQSAAALQVRNDLSPELQITQTYMAGKLGQAAYIFPNGSNVQMSATGFTSQSPSGSQNWRIGTDPIIAFVLPPKTVQTGSCIPSNIANATTYCYAFYAFYAIKRSTYVGTATVPGVTGADNPGTNPANDPTAWVLMEYRGYYSDPASYPGYSFPYNTTAIPTGNRGRLLMDYLAPYSPSPSTQLFVTNVNSAQTLPASQVAGVATVTMNLVALQVVANQTIRIPTSSSTAFSTVTVYPRNVGKPQLSN
jgi:prepilin-type N-terminal cleavage/methylation domain-containing protein